MCAPRGGEQGEPGHVHWRREPVGRAAGPEKEVAELVYKVPCPLHPAPPGGGILSDIGTVPLTRLWALFSLSSLYASVRVCACACVPVRLCVVLCSFIPSGDLQSHDEMQSCSLSTTELPRETPEYTLSCRMTSVSMSQADVLSTFRDDHFELGAVWACRACQTPYAQCRAASAFTGSLAGALRDSEETPSLSLTGGRPTPTTRSLRCTPRAARRPTSRPRAEPR